MPLLSADIRNSLGTHDVSGNKRRELRKPSDRWTDQHGGVKNRMHHGIAAPILSREAALVGAVRTLGAHGNCAALGGRKILL